MRVLAYFQESYNQSLIYLQNKFRKLEHNLKSFMGKMGGLVVELQYFPLN